MVSVQNITYIGMQYPECPFAEKKTEIWSDNGFPMIVCCHSNPCPGSFDFQLCAGKNEKGECPYNRPANEENIRKRKVLKDLETSWEDTINPDNPFLKKLSRSTVILTGFSEISGYLNACKQFNIIDLYTINQLREYYKNECERKLKDEFYLTKNAILKRK